MIQRQFTTIIDHKKRLHIPPGLIAIPPDGRLFITGLLSFGIVTTPAQFDLFYYADPKNHSEIYRDSTFLLAHYAEYRYVFKAREVRIPPNVYASMELQPGPIEVISITPELLCFFSEYPDGYPMWTEFLARVCPPALAGSGDPPFSEVTAKL